MPLRRQPPAFAIRVMHAALTFGLTLIAVVLALLVSRQGPVLRPAPPGLAVGAAALAITLMVVAAMILRRRVPPRGPEQSTDQFWDDMTVRTGAVAVWAVTEAGGMLAVMGSLLTGSPLPALAVVFAIFSLVWQRPATFE